MTTYLEDKDFHIEQGKSGNLLCTNISGMSLKFFFTEKCNYCRSSLPEIHSLNGRFNCIIALVNVGKYPNVVRMSNQTISPITVVPFIMLYINGKPYIRYHGDRTAEAISKFITEISSRISFNQNFMKKPTQEMVPMGVHDYKDLVNKHGAIPYNIVCEAEQCYLEMGQTFRDMFRS